MKKKFCAISVLPSLLIASGVIFASDGSVMELSDVSGAVQKIIQEQKDFHGQPGGDHGGPGNDHGGQNGGDHGGQPGNHGGFPGGDHGGQNGGDHGGQNGGDHGGQPGNHGGNPGDNHGGQPGDNHGGFPGGDHGNPGDNHGGQPNPQPHPQPVVDTSNARNEGMRDGAMAGEREGRQQGYTDGINAGERDGRDRGTSEGDAAGRQVGYKDGYTVDQSAGTQKGNADGQNSGITAGTQAGQKRCYDAGYTSGYNSAFATAKQLGLQDAASYNNGYAKGQTDASGIEAQNGQKAGYQAGFSQRETELQSSSFDTRGAFATRGLTRGVTTRLPIKLARMGYSTPEEQRAYQEAYQDGYHNSYQRSYDDAKRQGFNERYQMAYRQAYDAQYSNSYRAGYSDGKDKGYQEAYNTAYNSTYNEYYDDYSAREYAGQRAQGLSSGQVNGQKEGFAAGSAEQTKLGYKAGYEKTAAMVYPGAYAAGKQAGIAAADKYYSENAVLKVSNISFYDENGNGKFEASENVMLKADVRNFGSQKSDTLAIVVKSERGEITLVPDLKAEGVGGRSKVVVNFKVGKLYDVVAPDSDALVVTFTEKGQSIGDLRQMYTRTNANKVGIVAKDGTEVTKKATWLFPGKVTSLNNGEKVVITGQDGSYYKVRKSEVSGGNWNEGFIKSDKLTLQ